MNVNRILLRRSATLKTFFTFDSTGELLESAGSARNWRNRLAPGWAAPYRVNQRLVNWLPLAAGRGLVTLKGSGNSVTLPPAAVMAASAAFETAWA